MGSAASTTVKPIEINKDIRTATSTRPETPVGSAPRHSRSSCSQQSVASDPPEGRQVRDSPADLKEERTQRSTVAELKTSQLQGAAAATEEFLVQGSMLQAASLERQVAELESERLDLQERVAELQERLLYAQVPPTPGSQTRTLQQELATAQLRTAHLEQELATARAQAELQVGKLKRKVKKLTSQLAAAKQEASIRHLELNDDMTSLQEENETLKALLEKKADGATASAADPEDDSYGTSRMKIILELSSQVSEQSERMARLEMELAEKEQELQALRGRADPPTHHRPPSGSSRPRNPSSDLRRSNSKLSRDSDSGVGMRGRRAGEEEERGAVKGGKKAGGRLGSASSFLSDSDSDWEATGPSSATHSAPPGCRAATALSSHKPRGPGLATAAEEDTWSVDGDATTEANYDQPEKAKKRSVLKSKQAKERDQRALGLLGPTLAFGGVESPDLLTPEATTTRMDFDTLHGGPMMAPISTM